MMRSPARGAGEQGWAAPPAPRSGPSRGSEPVANSRLGLRSACARRLAQVIQAHTATPLTAIPLATATRLRGPPRPGVRGANGGAERAVAAPHRVEWRWATAERDARNDLAAAITGMTDGSGTTSAGWAPKLASLAPEPAAEPAAAPVAAPTAVMSGRIATPGGTRAARASDALLKSDLAPRARDMRSECIVAGARTCSGWSRRGLCVSL